MFDPFGWRLLSYAGVFLRQGRLPGPPAQGWLLGAAMAVAVVTSFFAWFRALEAVLWLQHATLFLHPLTDKPAFGLLLLVHFLVLVLICVRLAGPQGAHLAHPVLALLPEILRKVRQQSLAIFVASMFLAQVLGMALDHVGRNVASTALSNLMGFMALLCIATLIRWFKYTPWNERRT